MLPTRNILFCITACLAGVFSACRSEERFAKEFVKNEPLPVLYVTGEPEIEVIFNLPKGSSPSEAFARRYFPYRIYDLRNEGTMLADSVFRQAFAASLMGNGFTWYADSMLPAFLSEKKQAFVVSFMQIWIEESGVLFSDSLNFGMGSFASFDTVVSRYDFSVWMQVNPLNDTILASPVLFASFYMTDFIQGYWSYDEQSGNYLYTYDFVPLTFDDMIILCEVAGQRIGNYLFDYFMNMHLYQRMGSRPSVYFTRRGLQIKPAGSERFIFMSQPEP